MAYRNFIFDESSDDEVRQAAAEQLAERLTSRWNEINNELERASYTRSSYDYDPEDDYIESLFSNASSPEEGQRLQDEYLLNKKVRHEAQLMELESIEGQLAHLGARIMRPYEHWNEEERYMEYAENRYSGRGDE